MTTPIVPTVTDELIAELEAAADAIKDGCELQGAEAEEAMFNFECAATPATILALLAERADLKLQVAAASADAERYRWLRSPEAWNGFQLVMEKGGVDLDAAIDAARNIAGGD